MSPVQVLTYLEGRLKTIKVNYVFHHDIRLGVQLDDDALLNCSEFYRGLEQGHLVSPLMPHVFSAAVIHIVQQRFAVA